MGYIKEHYVFEPEENGCKRHDNCFTCPFPDCLKDSHENRNVRKEKKGGRKKKDG